MVHCRPIPPFTEIRSADKGFENKKFCDRTREAMSVKNLVHIHTHIHAYLYSAKNRENESEALKQVVYNKSTRNRSNGVGGLQLTDFVVNSHDSSIVV